MESLRNLDDPVASLLRFVIVGEFIEYFLTIRGNWAIQGNSVDFLLAGGRGITVG